MAVAGSHCIQAVTSDYTRIHDDFQSSPLIDSYPPLLIAGKRGGVEVPDHVRIIDVAPLCYDLLLT
ncbi:MAG: hypothetical protein R3293_03965 [Candidatus Promineifilaceae bacterium]|nr:hypothetical protein [Candidatus Promineifilaceae bacterium]